MNTRQGMLRKNNTAKHSKDGEEKQMRFTDYELNICRNTDLVSVCEQLGYHVKKIGQHYHELTEMDSVRIKDRRIFYRYSRSEGGSSIDFLTKECGMEWVDAVRWLLEFNGITHEDSVNRENDAGSGRKRIWYDVKFTEECEYQIMCRTNLEMGNSGLVLNHQVNTSDSEKETAEKEFSAPERQEPKRLRKYLTEKRKITPALVEWLLENNLIFETAGTGNVAFAGIDPDGITRHISLRGTYTPEGKKAFKGTVTGSDVRFSFHIDGSEKKELVVCEAPIDCISILDLSDEMISGGPKRNYLALTGTHDRALEQYLLNHPEVKIIYLCLDHDEPGQMACERIREKYRSGEWENRGLEMIRICPKIGKDFNEMLIMKREGNCERLGL